MKDYYTTNSHYLTYTVPFRRVERMHVLNLGVEGLRRQSHATMCTAKRSKNLTMTHVKT